MEIYKGVCASPQECHIDFSGILDMKPRDLSESRENLIKIAEDLGVQVHSGWLEPQNIVAAEVYITGALVCRGCESYEDCRSPSKGWVPMMSERPGGSWGIDLRKCDKRILHETQESIQNALKGAAVPQGYAQMGFRGIIPVEGQRRAYEAAMRLSANEGKGLVLWGPTGTGKTHFAVACLRNWLARGGTGAYLSMPDAVDRMRGDFGEAAAQVLEAVGSAGLLVLDDLGAERRTDYTLEAAYRLINQRLMSGLPAVATTNYSPDDLAARYGGVEGERIVSRLAGLGEWIEVQGRDWRMP